VKPADPNNASDVNYAIGAVNGRGGAGGNVEKCKPDGQRQLRGGYYRRQRRGDAQPWRPVGQCDDGQFRPCGSVLNIQVAGSIGNDSATVAIKSYNNILQGQTMQNFVDNFIVGNPSSLLSDSVGNVGLVAGAAGNTEGGQISTAGVNGSVNTVYAENITSMVAGNVTRWLPSRASPITA